MLGWRELTRMVGGMAQDERMRTSPYLVGVGSHAPSDTTPC